ncbi:hypothetical protein, partial [Paracoccus pantotrophus]|uniref:hypothetical protein n=1 Tax=Paracoccus pantotrophus TaxID=82367 RepID=UPI0035B4544E
MQMHLFGICSSSPGGFILDPLHRMPGPAIRFGTGRKRRADPSQMARGARVPAHAKRLDGRSDGATGCVDLPCRGRRGPSLSGPSPQLAPYLHHTRLMSFAPMSFLLRFLTWWNSQT